MILPDGTFMKADDFQRMLEGVRIVEVRCPKCKAMTRTEDLGNETWLCYDCGTVFSTED